jgi:hypothetical protein
VNDADKLARTRYYAIASVHMVATAGAVFGLVLAAKAHTWPQQILGGAIVLSALYVMAVVPKALARMWRTPQP